MLDILSYPIDKYYPLELFEIEAANDSTINDSDIWENPFLLAVFKVLSSYCRKFPLSIQMDLPEKKKTWIFYKNGDKKFQAKSYKNRSYVSSNVTCILTVAAATVVNEKSMVLSLL